ncbi:RING-H2 finger protein ATL20-like isoform X1 [Solanum pennellii]|uniref:RING-type E3 ubiquitin transferase n=1 Tax=Solanum pennellii TaxID=28526 RepID=A0ABM1FDJ4_SOLPN|nr:RING-H2 finger protein ATL20-like isoform X1 [Solanum pennellii]
MSSRETTMLVLMVTISLLVPSLLCLICIVCRLHLDAIRRRQLQVLEATSTLPRESSVVVNLPTSGLDDCMIQSYKKVVLGESLRLPGLNSLTCPICLVEYIPGDSIRIIPVCQHCFHVQCIDGWLKMKSTCPVCRNSPPDHRENEKA